MTDDGDEFFVVGGNGEELPEELKHALRKILENVPTQETTDKISAEDLTPAFEQLQLVPGDLCLLAMDPGETVEVDKQFFTLVAIQDPKEHAEQYPDWAARLVNGYLPGMWYGEGNPGGELGWFSRVMLLKIEPWQWDEVTEHNARTRLINAPSTWMTRRYNEILKGLSEANPDRELPTPIACGECGSLTVEIILIKTTVRECLVGAFHHSKDKDPNDFYTTSNSSEVITGSAKLQCLTCKTETDLDLNESNVYLD